LPRWARFARKWEIGAIGAVSSRFARRAPRYPDRPRRAGPQRVQGRRRARRREILAGPSRPCAHLSSLGSIARSKPSATRERGAGQHRPGIPQASLKTTCKPMSARLRMNFSCPGPRARGGAPRRGAIDAKSGEPLTPSPPLRARVPRDPGAGSRRLRPLGGRYSAMIHEEGERPL
jgi:hypothetical protein